MQLMYGTIQTDHTVQNESKNFPHIYWTISSADMN